VAGGTNDEGVMTISAVKTDLKIFESGEVRKKRSRSTRERQSFTTHDQIWESVLTSEYPHSHGNEMHSVPTAHGDRHFTPPNN